MEIYTAIFISLLVGLASTLFSAAAKAVVHLFAHAICVTEQAQVSALDRLLADSGWCSARHLGAGRLPADGVHFAFVRGPLFAVRSSGNLPRGGAAEKYAVYAVGRAAVDALQQKLMGDPRDVVLRYVYVPAPWRTSAVSVRCASPSQAYPWQGAAVARLLDAYRGRSRASALVCGAPGVGKSSLGELLAVALRAAFQVTPEVVKNLDLTQKGLLLEDAFAAATVGAPVIIMLDEFDGMVDHAEGRRAHRKGEGSSLADSANSLLSVLDRLNRSPFHIVVATTNKSLETMRGELYARYVRKGRLDLHVAARHK